jgi:hypothetical protein
MPFAGDSESASTATETLLALRVGPGDELILADNSAVAPPRPGVTVVAATGERSPARARNAGAEGAGNDWILFLDADCWAPQGLLDAYFSEPVADDVGALAGEVLPASGARTLAARYASARSFLGQQAHLAHPYRPRAVAANLLVRRAAFEQLGGFYEGLRAAEDTDFSWRLQAAGWRLELRPDAAVEHRYRTTLRELRRQWRGYAAGRAWLARRYDGFRPEPALSRALTRARFPHPQPSRGAGGGAGPSRPAIGRLDRVRFRALDALLAGDELAGFALSNRPRSDRREPVQAVLIADRFPAVGDPLVELARTIAGARVEAIGRPELVDLEAARAVRTEYREDDGAAGRLLALARLLARHPLRSLIDLLRRRPGEPTLAALAPAVLRLERDRAAQVHGLGSENARRTARRLAALAGRPLGDWRR